MIMTIKLLDNQTLTVGLHGLIFLASVVDAMVDAMSASASLGRHFLLSAQGASDELIFIKNNEMQDASSILFLHTYNQTAVAMILAKR